jgi:pimeloyl-ACP methyl ester carboxylesterase
VDADGLRTHVTLAGAEDAPPVLLAHGWPQNWWAWRSVVPALAEHFRVIVPDLRGHGWTEATRTGYEKEQLAKDLLAVLDALGVRRTTWVGHDWGAWSGFLAALRAPERIERMLALCVPHPWTPRRPRQLAMLGYQGPLSLPLLGRRLATPIMRAILRSGRGGQPLAASDLAVFAEHLPAEVTVAMYRTFLIRETIPLARGRYADAVLDVPTTLMVGAHDLVTSGAHEGSVDGQQALRVEVVEGVGHWLPEQRAAKVVEWVEQGVA